MAKYIIDLDALDKCLNFISEGKIDGKEFVFLQNVKMFIAGFPKYKIEETLSVEMKSNIELSEEN